MLTAGDSEKNKILSRITIIALTVIVGILIFTKLGYYSLWDDEAITALSAKAVLQTGDTSILIDHGKNIVAYYDGVASKNLHERSNAPFCAYTIAASFKFFGQSTFAARLPFAFLGLLAFIIALWNYRQHKHGLLSCLLLGIAVIGNTSFLLYIRQARYYGAVIFFLTVLLIAYLKKRPTAISMLLMALSSFGLFLCHYMLFFGIYCALAVDYIWLRPKDDFSWKKMLQVLIPTALACLPFTFVWNPLETGSSSRFLHESVWQKIHLFWWQWRDMNTCEFMSFGMLILILGCYLYKRDLWLLRGCVTIFVYVCVITIVTPQLESITHVADIRYLLPVIPVFIATSLRALLLLFAKKPYLTVTIALSAYCTNLFNGGLAPQIGLHSTPLLFARELIQNNPDPYRETSDWINKNIPSNASVWVLPDYMAYSLMFHAPGPIYGWQLSSPPKGQFQHLAPIFFQGMIAPEYIICFGKREKDITKLMPLYGNGDLIYKQIATINCFWKELYRPELFWRSFGPITDYNRRTEAIYILQRQS